MHLHGLRTLMGFATVSLTITYILLHYLSPAVLFPHLPHSNLMMWLATITVLMCLPRVVAHPELLLSSVVYTMIGLMAAVPISLVGETSIVGVLWGLREFLANGVVFFLVIASLDSIAQIRVLAYSTAMVAIYLLTQSLSGWYRNGLESQYVRVQHIYDASIGATSGFARLQSVGVLADPNEFAQFLLVTAALLTLGWRSGSLWRNVASVILPTSYLIYGVLATRSRSGLIGLSMLVFLLLAKRFRKTISASLSIGLLGFMYWGGAAGPRTTSLSDPDIAGRINAGHAAMTMFRDFPVLGVGFMRFGNHYPSLTAHNSVLLCLAELGIFGCTFWLGLIVFSIRDLNRVSEWGSERAPALGLTACTNSCRIALFTFLATACFLSGTYSMTLYLLLGMAAAIRELNLQQLKIDAPLELAESEYQFPREEAFQLQIRIPEQV